jgi:predicted nucleic acid-binding protein
VSLVLDTSATLAWLFPNETTPAILAVFDEVIQSGATVPDLWRIEVANCLTVAMRGGRINTKFRSDSLADLGSLMIISDNETGKYLWTDTVKIADKHKLTIYDATYLELALRRALPLATLDKQLRSGAKAEGVQLLGV